MKDSISDSLSNSIFVSNDTSSSEWKRELTETVSKVLGGKRFCTTCQAQKPGDTGIKLKARWLCFDCNTRRELHLKKR